MTNTLRSIGILLVLLAVTATGAGFSWSRLDQLQKSPVAFGVRADGAYTFGTKSDIDYGLSGELLFPLVSAARLRAQLLSLTIVSGNHGEFAFNTDIGFDALVAYPLRRSRVFPYAYIGAGLTTFDSSVHYVLRGGLGVEGKVAGISRAIAEVGVSHMSVGTSITQLRASVGARFGK